jgi:hypothetical protein
MFIKEDFPTFERPIKAYSGMLARGKAETLVLLQIKVADFIIILQR